MKLSDFEHKKLLFRGDELKVKIETTVFPQTRLKQKEDILTISLSSYLKTDEEKSKEVSNQIMLWYKAQARRFFTQTVESEKAKYNFEYKGISIKDTVTRWGSCSTKKNFNFNWRLVMAPPNVLNYVVIHEIAHLTFMNHSKDFWSLVQQRFPNYIEAKNWLKTNGALLINFHL